MLKKYFERHFSFDRIFTPADPAEQASAPARRQVSRGFKRFLFLLSVLPYLCGAGFLLSFFIDFGPEDVLPIFGYELHLEAFLRMVTVSGLIGFGTNWVAIQMLFRPVVRRPIWGQGLIPAQKDRIVWQLAGGIHRHILNEDMIRERIEQSQLVQRVNDLLIQGVEGVLEDEEFRREIKAMVYQRLKHNLNNEETRARFSKLIDEKLDEHLQGGLKGMVFKTYKRWNKSEYDAVIQNLLDRVPGTVVEIIEEMEGETHTLITSLRARRTEMEDFLSRVVIDVLERIDIHALLSKQMSHFDEARLEQMIWNATNEQLLYIEYLGTLLGILGGLVIWQPLIMGGFFVGLMGLLFLLDQVLYRLKHKAIGNKA
jgi:uncharacterized membrane protein YheB (UPF0754 family)